jgi:hypothetical protein
MAAISSILENAKPAEAVKAKQHAHELLEQLNADQIAAVLQLLEVPVEPDDAPLTEEDRRGVGASREYFRQNPEGGVCLEKVVADLGFTMDQIRGNQGE